MAARRTPAEPKPEGVPRPSAGEIDDAITRWRMAAHAASIARDVEQDARTKLVDVLRRAGLTGLVL